MKLNSTENNRSVRWIAFLFHVLLLTLFFNTSYAQTRNYATVATVKSPDVDDATNATTAGNTFANVKSYAGIAVGIGNYSGELELKFPSNVAANTTTYLRVEPDQTLLNVLLNGNLGGLLGNVVGGVVLGNHYFEVGARNSGGTTVLTGSSANSFTDASGNARTDVRLIKDANGLVYMAITPNVVYDRVYLKDVTRSILGLIGTGNATKVYNAFTVSGTDPCSTAFATSQELSGLTVDILKLGQAGVTNSERAIDADPNSYSEISLGVVGVAGSVAQNIFFSNLTRPGDEFYLRLQINPALISAGLLNDIMVTAYNGNTVVFSQSVNSLLTLDLLGLLNSGQVANIPFIPLSAFDRVKVTLNSIVGLGLTQTVRLYNIFASAPRPTLSTPAASTVNICYNTSATLTATTGSENELIWYDVETGGTALATTAYNVSYVTPNLTATKTYYVAARRIGCTPESGRVAITVVVNPLLTLPTTILANGNANTTYSKQLTPATGGTAPYTYALAAGSTLPPNLTLSTSGLLSGTPTTAGNSYPFSITVTDSKGCTTTTAYAFKVTPSLALPPATLPNGITQTPYVTQTIPSATGGTTPYAYTATNLPPGLTFDPATRQISGTPITIGTYVVNVVVTDADGYTANNNYSITIKDPLVLPPATLADGTVGVPYTPQIIPLATGGTTPYTYSATNLPPGIIFTPGTREFSGTPTVAGTYVVPVTVTDAEGKTATTNYTIKVYDPLVLPGKTLADGTVAVSYATETIPSATGGSGSYTYTASNVPSGLTFDPATRQISGTPTQSGTFTISVQVKDSDNRTASNTYSLKVNGALNLPTAALPNGVLGTVYPTQTLPAVIGGSAPYTYSATGLPPGLSFNSTTREISGTPTLGGPFTVSVTAKDSNGNSTITDYTLLVTVPNPVVAAATICSGQSTTLSVSNTITGVTISYNWYGATGNTVLATTSTYNTGALTVSTTYYVEAVSGTQKSSRVAVQVTVNPLPSAAVITTNNQVISSGQSTTLQATAQSGETINWYTVQTGGTSAGTGTSFNTGVLTTTTIFYAETVGANGCINPTRVPVTVTVTSDPANPNCNAAKSQQSGINGICLLCSITGAGNSVDNNTTNSTGINLTVGVGATGYQRLIFASAGLATDSVRLDLETPTGLANIGVLGGITINIMNGGTIVKTVQLNNNLINLQLLSGNRFKATLLAGAAFDRVEVRLAATVSALSNLNIYGAEIIYPKPTINTSTASICANTGTTLTATPNGGTTLAWYSVPTGGTALIAGNSYTTPNLATTTTYYIEVIRSGCANPERVPVVVTVNPVITFAGTLLNNATVGSNYTKQIDPATGGTAPYTYALATGNTLPAGLVLAPSGQIGGTPTTSGNYTFSITATDSKGCTATAAFALKVTNTLTLASGNLPYGVVNSVYAPQTLPAATGGSTPYTYTATNVPAGLTYDPATRILSGTPTVAGQSIITINVQDADGNTAVATYNILIKPQLALPTTALADGIVGTAYPTQILLPATGGSTPYTYSLTGLPNGLSFDPATREMTGVPTLAGTYPLVLTVKDADGNTATANYSIRVKDPLTLPNKTLADGTQGVVYVTETLPSAVGGIAPYTYSAINLPPGLTFDPATRQIAGTPTQAGNYTITMTANDSDGKTVSNTYALKVIGALNLPTANLPNGIVGTVYSTQTLPAVTGGTAPYTYVATNLPPGLNFNPATREITGTPTLGGTFVITLTATDVNNNKVATNYSITVTVGAPTANNATVCIGTPATLQVSNLQTGVTISYNWYGPTGSTPLATNNNGTFTTPAITGPTTFYVEAISGTAVSSRTAVTVNTNPAPDAPVILTTSQTINSGQSAILQASVSAGNTINWYSASTGGTLLGSGTNFSTGNLTATTTFYAEAVSASGCVSAARSAATVTVIPAGTPNCDVANKQSSGITGICLLCNIADPGNSIDANLNNFTRITLAVGVGATGFQRLTFGNPGAATDSIRLDLATPVGLLDLSVLSNVTISVLNAGSVVASYPLNSNVIDLKLLTSNRFKATFVAGVPFDGVEVRFSAVVGALSSLDIYSATTIYPKPTVSAAGTTVCSGSGTTLSATPSAGTSLKWYNAAGDFLVAGNQLVITNLTATTTYYIEVSKNGCANTERVPVTVTVTPAIAAPVVAAVAPTCSGTVSLLTVSNPNPAYTYNWYDVAVGGTPVNVGPTFTTPQLTANKTYYVEATQGTCISVARTAVNVTINPRPLPPTVQSSNSKVSPGQSAVLTASSTETNVQFKWYTTEDGTTPVFTGETFITPPLLVTTSYWVEASNLTTGCASATRVKVIIEVDGGGPNPVPCEAPLTQINGVSGIAVLAGVTNPELAIDNNTLTGSTLFAPVGAVGAYVYQRLNFGSLSNVGDTVRILITSPAKLLSLGLLSGLNISTLNGNTNNNDAVPATNPLISLELLSGSTQALLTFVPTNVFDAVEVRLNSGLLGALTTVNVNYAQRVIARPQVAASTVNACATQTAVLSVLNPKSNLTYKWYDAVGTYQAGKDGPTFTTPVLTGNTKYFVAASSASGCLSAKTQIDVTTVPVAAVPELVSNSINVCTGNDAILQVKNPIAGIVYRWYNSAGVYQAGKDGVTFTATNVTATTTYSVEAVNSCNIASARTTGTINAGAVDKPIVTPSAISVSPGAQAALTASSSTAGAVFNWYATETSTTILHTGATYFTDPITVTTTLWVEAVVPGPCPVSGRTPVTITVVPNTDPDLVPCGSATVSLATGVTGIGVLGGVSNPNFAVDNQVGTGSSLVIPVGALGASVYHQVGFAGGLSRVGDTLRVRLTSPGKLLSLAVLPSITLTTFNGATSNADGIASNNPLIQLNLLSDNSAIILTYVPTKTFDGVEVRLSSGLVGALTSIDFNYAQRINAAPQVTAATASTCQGSSAVLSVRNPQAGVVYRWYLETTYQTGKDGVTFLTDPALPAGTYNYYVKAFANGCESAPTKVVVTVIGPPAPPAPVIGNPTKACLGSPATLRVQQVAGVTYNWYDASGNLLLLNSSSYTTSATLAAGTYDFFVEAVNGNNCTNAARTRITLTINPLSIPGDVTVSGLTTICGATNTTLTASSATVTNPIFTWYNDAALTDVAFVGAVFSTPTISGTKTYYVTVSGDNKCPNAPGNAKVITITIKDVATPADIVANNATICVGQTATLTASSAGITNPVYTWYNNPNLTSVANVGATFLTPVLNQTTNYYVTVKGDNRCENTIAKVVTVTVNTGATLADLAVSQPGVICGSGTTTITASTTTVTNPVFTWYRNAALTDVAFVGATFQTPLLTQTTTYYVTIQGSNRCVSTGAAVRQVTVTVNPYANPTDIVVANATVCAGSRATLVASSTTVTNPVFTWYSNAALTTVVNVGATFLTPPVNGPAPTTYYVTVKGDNRCENLAGNGKPVVITVTPLGTSADITANDATICAGSAATLTASSTTVTNPVFTWYNDANLTSVAFVGATFSPSPPATRSYYVTVKGDNRCENGAGTAKVVTVTVNNPSTLADLTVTQPAVICGTGSTTITASTTTVTSPVFTWYRNAALTDVAFVGPTFVTPVLTQTTTYYVTIKGSNRCESTAATAKAVTVTVRPIAVSTDITVAGPRTLCDGDASTLVASSTTVTNPVFTWYTDATLTTVALIGPVFSTGPLSANKTYYVTVKGDNRCENTAASALVITITVNPRPVPPVVSATGLSICAGNTTTLTISNPVTGVTYSWYAAAVGGAPLTQGTSYTTGVLNATTDYYVEATNASGCGNAGGRIKVTVTVTARPVAPTVAATDVSVCSGTVAVLSVSNPSASLTYNWFTTAVGGTSAGTGVNFTTPIITANRTFYVETSNGTCQSPTRTPVNVTAIPIPNAPASITVNPNPICGNSTATVSVNNPDPTINYRWYTTPNGGTSIFEGPVFTTPFLNATITYYVESSSKIGGCSSTGRTPATVTVLPVLSPPVVNVQSTTPFTVTFAWAPVTGAASYEVSLDGGNTWILPTGGATGTTYVVTGLQPDQTVTISVRAKGTIACQTSSNAVKDGTSTNPFADELYIPNTFTPNGDGNNDVFLAYGNTVTAFTMTIYNQWGELYFRSPSITQGWDGSYKGTIQPNGVYVYYITVTFKSGASKTYKGTITLLR